MRGPNKKRLREDAEFTERRRRGVAGITVPEQQVPREQLYGFHPIAYTYTSYPSASAPFLDHHSAMRSLHPDPYIASYPFGEPDISPGAASRRSPGPFLVRIDDSLPNNTEAHPNMHLTSRPQIDNTSLTILQYVPDQQKPPNNPLAGTFMTRESFRELVDKYILDLPRKNREKALLSQSKYDDILQVLLSTNGTHKPVEPGANTGAATELSMDSSNVRNDASEAQTGDGSQNVPSGSLQDLVDVAYRTNLASDLRIIFHSREGIARANSATRLPSGAGSQRSGGSPRPQFRAWIQKNFMLKKDGDTLILVHNGRQVAVQEQLYDILVLYHGETGHGGRDKTYASVCKHYVRRLSFPSTWPN